MKAVIYILSIVLIQMSMVPCTDAEWEHPAAEVSIQAASTEEEPVHADQCSPFCACHCCHVHVLTHDAFTVHFDGKGQSGHMALPVAVLSGFNQSIWDPPAAMS